MGGRESNATNFDQCAKTSAGLFKAQYVILIANWALENAIPA